jgi:hypothetical protein
VTAAPQIGQRDRVLGVNKLFMSALYSVRQIGFRYGAEEIRVGDNLSQHEAMEIVDRTNARAGCRRRDQGVHRFQSKVDVDCFDPQGSHILPQYDKVVYKWPSIVSCNT